MSESNRKQACRGIGRKAVVLAALGMIVGACAVATPPDSASAVTGAKAASQPMTGATLSTLHASIPGTGHDSEVPPSI